MTTVADLDLARIAGAAAVRPGAAADAILGVTPRLVVEPASAARVAATLAACTAARTSVVVRGGGSRLAWGRTPRPVDVLLSLGRLGAVNRYEPGDLTVSVGAGISIAALNQQLGQRGQWLPIDHPSAAATIGGAIATGESGPLRHRYGSVRDQLIGIRLATAAGQIASAGGNVVKNVAGYDLGKFVSGSFGTLAVIVDATFKLAPLPAATATLVVACPDAQALNDAAQALASSQLDLMALEAMATVAPDATARFELVVRFGGPASVNRAQMTRARELAAAAARVQIVEASGADEVARWRELGAASWAGTATAVRASWLPAALGEVLTFVCATAASTGVRVDFAGRAALGTGVLHLEGASNAVALVIARLRGRIDLVGHVVIMRAPSDVTARVDVWGDPGPTAPLLAAIKGAMDPAGILNAGRGPI
jgi:glycolate oxidase FAD binding subunit